MKTRITLYILLFSLLLNSCSESFLDTKPQGSLTPEVFLENPENIKLLTRTMYGADWFGYLEKPLYLYGDVLPGNMVTEGGAFALYMTRAFDGSNVYIDGGWRAIYGVITHANQNIRNLLSIEAEAGSAMGSAKNTALGESRFFRAYAYSLLVNYWGAVPVVLDNAEDVSTLNYKQKRVVEEDVYDVIIRDLTDAIDKLPETAPQPDLTKISAKALLAKVHLTRAGMSFGTADDFTKAKELAGEVITNAAAAGYGLLDNYRDLWVATGTSNSGKNSNKETLYSWHWDYPSSNDYYGLQNSLQSYFASDVFSASWEGWSSVVPSIDLIGSWEPGDLRRHYTMMEDGNFYPEFWKDEGGFTYDAYTSYYGGPVMTLSHIRKHLAGKCYSSDGDNIADMYNKLYTPIIRLADVYLTYAEAVLAKNASTSDRTALGYFNTIRSRAGLTPVASITYSDLYLERRHEFAFEFVNWADLLRYNRLHPNEVQTMLTNQERGYYKVDDAHNKTLQSYKLPSVTASFFVLPLPSTETLKDPALLEDPVSFDFNKYR